jgi:hypothetical protein
MYQLKNQLSLCSIHAVPLASKESKRSEVRIVTLLAVIFIESMVSLSRSLISIKAEGSTAKPNARLDVITTATYFSAFAASSSS